MNMIKRLSLFTFALLFTLSCFSFTSYAAPIPGTENADYFIDETEMQTAIQFALVESKADQIIDQMYQTLGNPTDVEKALYLHDWICVHARYDFKDEHNEKPHGDGLQSSIILDGVGVCEHYANTYKYLLSKAGIKSELAGSAELDHVWNLITIDNENYYVDCTFDDVAIHYRGDFLISKEKCYKGHESTDWSTWYVPTSDKYDNYA